MTETVQVCRNPGSWQFATYRVEDIESAWFDKVSGGVRKELPTPMLCALVWCDGMIEGELAHSCTHGKPPHLIRVVIPKSHNDLKIWSKLAGQEYKEPKPLDLSPEAVKRRHDRAVKSALTRAKNRETKVGAIARAINEKWPVGRPPSGENISYHFEVPKAVARDARRKAIAIR